MQEGIEVNFDKITKMYNTPDDTTYHLRGKNVNTETLKKYIEG